MSIRSSVSAIIDKTESCVVMRTIRGGLVQLVPVLIIGTIALVAKSFPAQGYITFITTFCNGILYNLFNSVYSATFGVLSVYMSFMIGYSYSQEYRIRKRVDITVPLISVVNFFILGGSFNRDFSTETLGSKGMFIAITAGLVSSGLYYAVKKRLPRFARVFSDGDDAAFSLSVSSIIPAAITVGVVVGINLFITHLFHVDTIYSLLIQAANSLYEKSGRSFGSGMFYVFLCSVLWFFGIHGSNCLEAVADKMFFSSINSNIAAVAHGRQPTEILTKPFFDIFVLMGGCGSALCLLLALLIFGKRRSDRNLSKIVAVPMIFNANEILIFGLPVILNFSLLVPFILVPIVCYTVSYAAMACGLVPLTTSPVEWTVPVLFGGYMATGSVAGSILQLVNLLIGTLIYAPFIKRYDTTKRKEAKSGYDELIHLMKESESSGEEIALTALNSASGEVARQLAGDLKYAINHNQIQLYYQPQYRYDGSCHGAEALLRWNHRAYGMIYPPLVIKLAEESNVLKQLEYFVLFKVGEDASEIMQSFSENAIFSVNITGTTLFDDGLLDALGQIKRKNIANPVHFCLEITEKTTLRFDQKLSNRLNQIKMLGFQLAIDDFSMGQTSICCLQGGFFDYVKLDGSLVSNILNNERSHRIVASVCILSNSLNVIPLAEYVETEEQKEELAAMGCLIYQGYLYSPAVPLKKLMAVPERGQKT